MRSTPAASAALFAIFALVSSRAAANPLDEPRENFTVDGEIYQRLNLTLLRSVPLGDRWEGEAAISGDTVRITSPEAGPAKGIAPKSIEARRP